MIFDFDYSVFLFPFGRTFKEKLARGNNSWVPKLGLCDFSLLG